MGASKPKPYPNYIQQPIYDSRPKYVEPSIDVNNKKQRIQYNDIRDDYIKDPNIKKAVFHSKDETIFIGHDKGGGAYIQHIQHQDYGPAFMRCVVPMFNNINKGKYISD